MSPKQSIYDQAYAAVKNNEYAFARRLLAQLLNQEPDHLNGWLLASYVMSTRAEAIKCLERALQIEPANPHAKQRMANLQKTVEQTVQQDAQQNIPDPSPTLLLHLSSERPTVPPESVDLNEAARRTAPKLRALK